MVILKLTVVLVAVLLFGLAGFSKLQQSTTIRFRLAESGLVLLATPSMIRALAFLEIISSGLGLVSIATLNSHLIGPMVGLLSIFSAYLALIRPKSCGCTVFEMGWWAALIRNLALMALLLPILVEGY